MPNIFERLQAGELLRKDDPEYGQFGEVVSRTIRLCVEMNATSTDVDQVRSRLSAIIGTDIDESTAIFPRFTPILADLSVWKKMYLSIMPVRSWILVASPSRTM